MTEALHGLRGVDASTLFAGPMADPLYGAREIVAEVPYPELGTVATQNVIARTSSPSRIKWAGPRHEAHTREIMGDLGYTEAQIADLRAEGVI